MASLIFYNLDLDATNDKKKPTGTKLEVRHVQLQLLKALQIIKIFFKLLPISFNNSIIVDNQQRDAIWFLLKTLSPPLGKMVPTWAAYNSSMGQKKPLLNIAML